jgi:hypothetical protein
MVGHKTEAIYRRYAAADETILRNGAEKLAALHEMDISKKTAPRFWRCLRVARFAPNGTSILPAGPLSRRFDQRIG